MYDTAKKIEPQVSKDLFPTEAWELISTNRENDLVIIDVSTPQEYKDLHLEGAINVSLISRFFKTRLEVMDRDKTYVVYCKVGGRSKIAQKLMKQFGFQTVYNITGGTLLWEEEGPHEVLIQGGGSLFVAVIAYSLMQWPLLMHLTFNFPELNLVLLAVIMSMGTTVPCSSTKPTRSASPSNATPKS